MSTNQITFDRFAVNKTGTPHIDAVIEKHGDAAMINFKETIEESAKNMPMEMLTAVDHIWVYEGGDYTFCCQFNVFKRPGVVKKEDFGIQGQFSLVSAAKNERVSLSVTPVRLG